MLTGIKGGGALEKYLGGTQLNPFINMPLVLERMVAFSLPEVEGLERDVKGLPTDLLIDICQGFVMALEAHGRPDSGTKLTKRQLEIAVKASMFVAACAKVGLDARSGHNEAVTMFHVNIVATAAIAHQKRLSLGSRMFHPLTRLDPGCSFWTHHDDCTFWGGLAN